MYIIDQPSESRLVARRSDEIIHIASTDQIGLPIHVKRANPDEDQAFHWESRQRNRIAKFKNGRVQIFEIDK